MERKVAVEASVPVKIVGFTVNSAYGGAGAALADTTPSRNVVIRNKGGRSFEYKVGAGAWTLLGIYQTAFLDVDLSSTTITVRKSQESGAADPTGQLEIEESGGDMSAGGEPIPLPGTGSRRQTGVDAVNLTGTDVAVSFTNTTAPAAKRSVVLPAERVDGRQIVLLPDGGDQAFLVNGNGKTVALASATGVAVNELANGAKTVMWSAALDKWLAW